MQALHVLTDARHLASGEELTADILIVGSGPAGLTLAHELTGSGLRILLLESGGLQRDEATQSLAGGDTTGQTFCGLSGTRARQFGGTSNLWDSRWDPANVGFRGAPLDPIDFEKRDWVPDSGWPFDRNHLEPYYRRAHETGIMGPYEYEPGPWTASDAPQLELEGDSLQTSIWLFGSQATFLDQLRTEVEQAADVTVLLNANVVELVTSDDGRRVTEVRAVCLPDKPLIARAGTVIVAAGGIENARLLLLSNRLNPRGIGNEHDVVGRYFMEHQQVRAGFLTPDSPELLDRLALYDERHVRGASVMGQLHLTDTVMRREKLMNSVAAFLPVHRRLHSFRWRSADAFTAAIGAVLRGKRPDKPVAALSEGLRARRFIAARALRKLSAGRFFTHWGEAAPSFVKGFGWATLPDRKRRFGMLDVIMHLEQAPNRENRVTLSNSRDLLGCQMAQLHWEWRRDDVVNASRVQGLLKTELARSRIGVLDTQPYEDWPYLIASGLHHHMGTTRIHTDPARGVVDENCRVHGVENLFMAGSSVFPSGGYINPTLTIMALAVRLADWVRSRPGNTIRPGRTPAAEPTLVPAEWNATDAEFPRDATVHQLFEAQARRSPDAVALIAGTGSVTFRTLDDEANRWAKVLRAHGVGRDTIVGLRTSRSPEMVIGMLAILKAGGAYLPLDVGYPAERTRFMLDDAGVSVVMTQLDLADELHGEPSVVLFLDGPVPPTVHDAVHHDADAESLAYVIYTSGSTGTPKGVLVHHRGVVNYLSWCAGAYDTQSGSGAPVHSSAAFDLTVTSLFAPLLAGRPVHLLDESLGVDALADALRDHHDYTLVKITPSHLDLLRHQLPAGEARESTRSFVIGGEALTSGTVAFWRKHAPGIRLFNEYGPTETVVGCCVYEIPPDKECDTAIPIGRPIANTQLYVLDDSMQRVPVGESGELYIGGEGVARGYLNRPELTAERFVPDVFRPGAGRRLYRTGDRVRYLADGNLEFLGRLDDQVKLRGYRIELGEVEAALAAQPAIAQACAMVLEGTDSDDRRLMAWYTTTGSEDPGPDELRASLAQSLPAYMIPAGFERVAALPLTSNGKIDRSALPALSAGVTRMREVVSPRSRTEELLAEIWTSILGVPVGVTDDFFDLGGHSLLAVRMTRQVRETFGHAPPLSVLLTRPTIESIAASLGGNSPDHDEPMLQLTTGAGGSPFFYLHGDFGGVGFYAHSLSRLLDPAQAMYTLRPHRQGEAGSIEEMAADYARLIQSVQPHGPYMLGGMCNAGLVAYEIARIFRQKREEVKLLALVNTPHRNAGMAGVRRAVGRVAAAARIDPHGERRLYLRARANLLTTMADTRAMPHDVRRAARARWWSGIVAHTMWRVATRIPSKLIPARFVSRRLDQKSTLPAQGGSDDPGAPGILSEQELHDRYVYINQMTSGFVARPYDGHATVIWWEESSAFELEPELHGDDLTRGWKDLCRSAEVQVLPGSHRAIPGRSVEALGAALRRLLLDAQPVSETPGARQMGNH